MLGRGIGIPSEEPINVNHGRGEQTEEGSKSNHDDVSNSQAERGDTTEVRILTAILIEGGRAGFDGTGKGRLAHDVVVFVGGCKEVKLG